MPHNRKTLKLSILSGGALIVVFFLFSLFFQVSDRNAKPERFIIPLENQKSLASDLKEKGFIKNPIIFNIISSIKGGLKPGGYKISKSMNVWQIAETLSKEPYMKWVIIPEGLRKEEVADILSEKLGWPESEKTKWVSDYTSENKDYIEGVYFPDTYLIPVEESPADIAKRLRTKFEEKFAPYAKEAASQNIKWTTLLKLASIIQREASGADDMPLISGILWNRLLAEKRLEVDATLQYARGDIGNGWWAPISLEDKKINSPFNSYKYSGLPPRPISNPGLNAIKAALNPEKTDCFFYLHDAKGNIHCSRIYQDHKKNIEKYL